MRACDFPSFPCHAYSFMACSGNLVCICCPHARLAAIASILDLPSSSRWGILDLHCCTAMLEARFECISGVACELQLPRPFDKQKLADFFKRLQPEEVLAGVQVRSPALFSFLS